MPGHRTRGYTRPDGRAAARALVLTRLAGQMLRVVYYSIRVRLPGRRAASYEPMQRYATTSTRALVDLALGRQ